jgi:hypothetical protein
MSKPQGVFPVPRKPKSNPKSKRGGRRAGAGRKLKSVTQLRNDFNATIADLLAPELPNLIENLLILAKGVRVVDTVKDKKSGEPKEVVFVAPPDRAANQYLIERLAGKVPDRHEIEIAKLTDEELLSEIAGAIARGEATGD